MKPLQEKDHGSPDHRTPARYLLWLLRAQWRSITAGAFFGVVWMLSQALMPAAIGRALGDGVAGRDERALLAWSGVLLGLGAVQAATGAVRHRFAVFNWLAVFLAVHSSFGPGGPPSSCTACDRCIAPSRLAARCAISFSQARNCLRSRSRWQRSLRG